MDDLNNLDSLRSGAATSDGVIHTAFNHDFSRFKENSENGRWVIEALGTTLAGSDRPQIITSAIGSLPRDWSINEEDMLEPKVKPELVAKVPLVCESKLEPEQSKTAVTNLPVYIFLRYTLLPVYSSFGVPYSISSFAN